MQPLPEADAMRFDSGIATRQRLVIRDQATWTTEWSQIVSIYVQQSVPPLPAVDFASNAVVVAAMGSRPTGGYAIEIDDVRMMGEDASISVNEQSPGNGCGVTAAFTFPLAVVLVPAFSGHATFVENTSEHSCQ